MFVKANFQANSLRGWASTLIVVAALNFVLIFALLWMLVKFSVWAIPQLKAAWMSV